jgi:WD40 repeat protein
MQPYKRLPPFISNDESRLSSLSFSPDARLLALGRESGVLEIWDCQRGVQSHRIETFEWITALAWDPSNNFKRIFVGSTTGRVIVLNDLRVSKHVLRVLPL